MGFREAEIPGSLEVEGLSSDGEKQGEKQLKQKTKKKTFPGVPLSLY